MIKISDVCVSGWEPAVRGLRNPYNSWDKSDSIFGHDVLIKYGVEAIIGNNDLELMSKLVTCGDCHAKFARYINVTADVTAPIYWWKEYDTYKVGTVADSCSTMHTIAANKFTLDDFSHEHLLGDEDSDDLDEPIGMLNVTIDMLNQWRECYLQDKDKDEWWQLIQLLPMSYNQKRTVQINYQVLRNMYIQRRNHKLDEWVSFCKWIEMLPHSEKLITCGVNK